MNPSADRHAFYLRDLMRVVQSGLGSTRVKVFGARFAFGVLQLLRVSPRQIVTRQGVVFDLDLREGIDLSVFLAGQFQRHVSSLRGLALDRGAVIFDVGANIGALALNWAHAFPDAHVYAFEPTDFAFEKLLRNIALNPDLQPRIVAEQAFVSSTTSRSLVPDPYASWRVDQLVGERHPVHMGEVKRATERVTTIDAYVAEHMLKRVDLVKVDTDGHELDVLRGARDTLKTYRPALIFEVGAYLLRERGIAFREYEDMLLPLGYELVDAHRGQTVSSRNLERLAPLNGTLDVLARASRAH